MAASMAASMAAEASTLAPGPLGTVLANEGLAHRHAQLAHRLCERTLGVARTLRESRRSAKLREAGGRSCVAPPQLRDAEDPPVPLQRIRGPPPLLGHSLRQLRRMCIFKNMYVRHRFAHFHISFVFV